VSRKNTQLAELASPDSGIRYLQEMLNKYPAKDSKFVISDVPSARGNPALSNWIGESLDGDMILEVPVQRGQIPQQILDFADEKKITMRDVTGHVYN
jgi:hypothetical protein